MQTVELVSVSQHAPLVVLDRVLTAAEGALNDLGYSRVWVDRQGESLTVLAEFAPAALAPA